MTEVVDNAWLRDNEANRDTRVIVITRGTPDYSRGSYSIARQYEPVIAADDGVPEDEDEVERTFCPIQLTRVMFEAFHEASTSGTDKGKRAFGALTPEEKSHVQRAPVLGAVDGPCILHLALREPGLMYSNKLIDVRPGTACACTRRCCLSFCPSVCQPICVHVSVLIRVCATRPFVAAFAERVSVWCVPFWLAAVRGGTRPEHRLPILWRGCGSDRTASPTRPDTEHALGSRPPSVGADGSSAASRSTEGR